MTFEKTSTRRGINRISLFAPATARLTTAIVLSTAMVAFESLSVSAALPEIGIDLRATTALPWTVTAYLLASGMALALAGSVLDRIGTRIVFRVAITAFVVASGLCAVAPSLGLLVLGRLVQGFAGGSGIASTSSAIGLAYPVDARSRAFALASVVWGVLAVSGPGIAAVLISGLGWRSIFWVNIPIGLFALALGWRAMPERPERETAVPEPALHGIAVHETTGTTARPSRFRFDTVGALAVATITIAGLLAVSGSASTTFAGRGPWLIAALTAAWFYWRHSARRPQPILERRFFARAPFRDLALASGLLMAGGMGVEAFLPLYLRTARDASLHLAAWSVLFLALGWTLGANAASRLYHRWSELDVIRFGTATSLPVILGVTGSILAGLPISLILALYLIVGATIGAVSNASLTLVQARAAQDEIGRATAAHQFLRNQSITFGTAAAGATMMGIATTRTPRAATGSNAAILDPKALDPSALDPGAVALGFASAHGVATVAAIAAILAARRLAVVNGSGSVQIEDQDANVDRAVSDGNPA